MVVNDTSLHGICNTPVENYSAQNISIYLSIYLSIYHTFSLLFVSNIVSEQWDVMTHSSPT